MMIADGYSSNVCLIASTINDVLVREIITRPSADFEIGTSADRDSKYISEFSLCWTCRLRLLPARVNSTNLRRVAEASAPKLADTPLLELLLLSESANCRNLEDAEGRPSSTLFSILYDCRWRRRS